MGWTKSSRLSLNQSRPSHRQRFAVLFHTCRLLALALPGSNDDDAPPIGAAFAALLFAIHPLRVESVAWAVERKDCLSGLFFLATVYFYLRANSDPASVRRWMVAGLAAYVLALLSKSIAVTLPAVLVLLDIYVLKRLPPRPRLWFTTASRRVLWEKIPYLLMGAALALISYLGESQVAVERLPVSHRIAQALLAPAWYVWKFLLPIRLAPLYETPVDFGLSEPWVIAGMTATVAATILFYLLRTRWLWACWLITLVVLAPVSGIVQTGGHEAFLAADGYTYLSFLGWAVLDGGALVWLVRRAPVQTRKEKRRGDVQRRPFRLPATAAATVLVAVLALLTFNQTKVWRDSTTLFTHMLKVDPNASIVHMAFGQLLAQQGNCTQAIPYFRRALEIRPVDDTHKNNRGHVTAILLHGWLMRSAMGQGRTAEAEEYWQQAFQLLATCSLKLCLKYEQDFGAALKPERLVEMGKALAEHGHTERAERHFERARRLEKINALFLQLVATNDPAILEEIRRLGRELGGEVNLN